MQLEYEGVFQRHQDLLLELDVLEVVLLLEDGLVEHLHGVVATCPVVLALLDEEDFGKAAFAQQTDDAYGAQVDVLAEIGRCIWATSLDHVVVQRYAFLDYLAILLLLKETLHRFHGGTVSRLCTFTRRELA